MASLEKKKYQLKPKKCQSCRMEFVPSRPLQRVCGLKCAIALSVIKRDKKQRKETRDRKAKLKTLSDYKKETQAIFNAYIRERDKDLPCISCGRHHKGQYHAGHYKTTKAFPELRYNEENCSKQCAPCNNHLSGNITEYRKNLIIKIGLDRVEWLEGPHSPAKYTQDELIYIKKIYKEKLKGLKIGVSE